MEILKDALSEPTTVIVVYGSIYGLVVVVVVVVVMVVPVMVVMVVVCNVSATQWMGWGSGRGGGVASHLPQP